MLNPLKVGVMGIQIACCEYAHECTKEEVCLGIYTYFMCFGASFRFAMHLSNVGSGAHFDKNLFKDEIFKLFVNSLMR
jgi:hypothetical protein